jgi:hypothetical protein
MPLQMELDSADLRRLDRALKRLGQSDLLEAQLKAIAQDIMGKTSKYPPAPPRGPVYYERGWGWVVNGVKQEKTSEDLKGRWYVKAFPSYAEIGNLASYAGYVHGDVQTAQHQRTGWLKLYDVALDNMPKLVEKAKANIRAIWEARV